MIKLRRKNYFLIFASAALLILMFLIQNFQVHTRAHTITPKEEDVEYILETINVFETNKNGTRNKTINSITNFIKRDNGPTIIWWTPFITEERVIDCSHVSCFVTSRRKPQNLKHALDEYGAGHRKLLNKYKKRDCRVGFLFYGTHFNKSDLPLPRHNNIWGLLHEESPRNSPLLNHEPVLSLFNYSSTFSRQSNLPLTVQYLPSLESITGIEFFKTFEQKNNFKFAPVIYIQSDCVTPNNRDSYVQELMKYIEVDSFGKCLNNKELPISMQDAIPNMMSPDLLELIGRYKFAISFENAICEDYITEKLWRPLIAGSIPLYIGSPSVKDWLPNNNSVILPMSFNSPKELADYLHYVSRHSEVYNKFLRHKLDNNIDNYFLKNKFNEYNQLVKQKTFVEEFECYICEMLHNPVFGNVNQNHYKCPEPFSILSKKYNISNWWHDDYSVSKCEANNLRHYIDHGLSLDKMVFNC